MTVASEYPVRTSSHAPVGQCLEDKFEILKEIGDGSFGSVSLARVRAAGSYVARRGSLVSSAHLSLANINSEIDRRQDNEEDF